MPHLRRYQGFAIVHYSVTLDALYLGHPRLSLNRGCRYRGPQKPPMCENNHNVPNLAKIDLYVVPSLLPKNIGAIRIIFEFEI